METEGSLPRLPESATCMFGCLSVVSVVWRQVRVSAYDKLITRPEESYRLWCVVCDLETSWIRWPWSTGGCCSKTNKLFTGVRQSWVVQIA